MTYRWRRSKTGMAHINPSGVDRSLCGRVGRANQRSGHSSVEVLYRRVTYAKYPKGQHKLCKTCERLLNAKRDAVMRLGEVT